MAKKKLIDPFNIENPIVYDKNDNKLDLDMLKVVKRGKGKRTPNITPMNDVFQEFINTQKGRGNSDKTILYYENWYKNFINFLVEVIIVDNLYDKYKDKEIDSSANDYKENLINNKESIVSLITVDLLEIDSLEERYREYLRNTGIKEISIATKFRGLRAFSYYCMEEEWIKQRKIKFNNPPAPIKDCYTDNELILLQRKPNTDEFLENRNWVIINYLLSCGNRLGSIVNLDIENVDFDDGSVSVYKQKNRNKIVKIPLINKMSSILRQYIYDYRSETSNGQSIAGNQPLFCDDNGKRLTEQGLYKAISEYNKSRGVSKTSIHLFRHTFAKKWILSGGDLLSLQRMLGQSSLRMVQHYANLYDTDIKPHAEKHSILANMNTSTGNKITKRNNNGNK